VVPQETLKGIDPWLSNVPVTSLSASGYRPNCNHFRSYYSTFPVDMPLTHKENARAYPVSKPQFAFHDMIGVKRRDVSDTIVLMRLCFSGPKPQEVQ
jgi:hypothetical protein